MNIIWAFIITTLILSQSLLASQSDANSAQSKTTSSKTTQAKQSDTKSKQPAQKQAAQKEKPAQKQPAQKEKSQTSAPAAPAQKKIKPSAASTAALLRQSATPGYIAPFENMKKPATPQPSSENPILKKNPIFQAPAKIQNLGNVEIGNSSKKPIAVSSLMFSYTFTNSDEKNAQTHTKTHKISFPQAYIIPPQKKLAFTITMKDTKPLQFAGIKIIQTNSGNVVFDTPITDLSNPIVLNLTKKGKIQYLAPA